MLNRLTLTEIQEEKLAGLHHEALINDALQEKNADVITTVNDYFEQKRETHPEETKQCLTDLIALAILQANNILLEFIVNKCVTEKLTSCFSRKYSEIIYFNIIEIFKKKMGPSLYLQNDIYFFTENIKKKGYFQQKDAILSQKNWTIVKLIIDVLVSAKESKPWPYKSLYGHFLTGLALALNRNVFITLFKTNDLFRNEFVENLKALEESIRNDSSFSFKKDTVPNKILWLAVDCIASTDETDIKAEIQEIIFNEVNPATDTQSAYKEHINNTSFLAYCKKRDFFLFDSQENLKYSFDKYIANFYDVENIFTILNEDKDNIALLSEKTKINLAKKLLNYFYTEFKINRYQISEKEKSLYRPALYHLINKLCTSEYFSILDTLTIENKEERYQFWLDTIQPRLTTAQEDIDFNRFLDVTQNNLFKSDPELLWQLAETLYHHRISGNAKVAPLDFIDQCYSLIPYENPHYKTACSRRLSLTLASHEEKTDSLEYDDKSEINLLTQISLANASLSEDGSQTILNYLFQKICDETGPYSGRNISLKPELLLLLIGEHQKKINAQQLEIKKLQQENKEFKKIIKETLLQQQREMNSLKNEIKKYSAEEGTENKKNLVRTSSPSKFFKSISQPTDDSKEIVLSFQTNKLN